MENTNIEWAHHTFNPWIGCQKVSPACDNCYAEAQDKRFRNGANWGPHSARTRTSAANWKKPLKWNKEAAAKGIRYRVFCASLADVFDNSAAITSGWHGDLWHLIHSTPQLDWLLLTKRPQNIKKMLPEEYGLPAWGSGWHNVWLGTTAENQSEADRRIPHLLEVPAKVRFLSCEPLLGPIDFSLDRLWYENCPDDCEYCYVEPDTNAFVCNRCEESEKTEDVGIDWIICGGESGPNARPMHPEWARSLRDQCKEAGVPFLFKQWGEWCPPENVPTYKNKGAVRTADWFNNEWNFGFENLANDDGHIDNEPEMFRIGKKHTGRLLDGKDHTNFPEGNSHA